MSPDVLVLPQTLINKIAAGEVIVRPASVIKELVDNSFDSGARRIRVEVSLDGRSITVADDGCGMDEANTRRAVLRNSTSKIREFDDLLSLKTRGFRGEALASIISVSRFEMLTRRPGDLSGTRLVASGGRVELVEPVGTAEGTTIHVRDLFYNTPARLKFLKSAAAEFNVLAQILTQQALSHPEIAITCLRNGETRFDLPAGQTMGERAEQLLGSSVQGRMIEVNYERDGIRVSGYVSRPEASRKDRRWQYLMINGRPISARQLSFPIQEAYHGLLMTQRFPVVVLDIGIDPAEVDVNVHPTKEEVRFEEEKKVAGLLHRAISLALREHNLMPTYQMTGSQEKESPLAATPEVGMTAASVAAPAIPSAPVEELGAVPGLFSQSAQRGVPQWKQALSARFRDSDGLFSPSALSPRQKPAEGEGTIEEFSRLKPEIRPDSSSLAPPSSFSRPAPELPGSSFCSGPPREPGSLDPPSGAALNIGDGPPPAVLGQLARTYIVAEWGDDLLLIDQHAAHERLVYRKLSECSPADIPVQPLFTPIHFEVAAADLDPMESLLPVLREMGMEIEKDGGNSGRMSFSVSALPGDFDSLDVGALVQDVLDDLHKNDARNVGMDDLRDKVRVRMACHGAIRAGQQLHPQEMAALIRDIAEARLSFTCPHGRPTMVVLRRDQLDRQFGRK